MTTDPYATVLFQDGEQLTFDDMNNMQRFTRAQVTDQILQQHIGALSNAAVRPYRGGEDGADASTLWAYCMNPGRAYLRQGSANNKIQLAPGTLLQKIGNAAGADSTLVPFAFAGTEEWTIASGDATNPRIDMLQMKLEYITDTPASVDFQDAVTRANTTVASTATRRRIQCTLSVKTGTPAASPRIPDPDTGFVPVGCAVVGHGWTSAGNAPIFGVDVTEANNVVIHDQRMPIIMRGLVVDPLVFQNETGWILEAGNGSIITNNATNRLFVKCPNMLGRVVAVDVMTAASLSTIGSLGSGTGSFGGPPSTFYAAGNGFGTNNVWSGVLQRSRRRDFEGLHTPAAGPTILPSTTNLYGVPLWASGYRTPNVDDTSGALVPHYAFFRIVNGVSGGVRVADVTFYVAGA